MVTYALDSSAVIRYLDDESGSARVAEIIKGHLSGRWHCIVSAIHWGEIAGVVYKAHGKMGLDLAMNRLLAFGLEVVPATAERALRAGLIKVDRKIPYADAFGVELAAQSSDYVFVTADFDVKPATKDVKIEFLSKK
jgi:predicted nucleic acid-binding protein